MYFLLACNELRVSQIGPLLKKKFGENCLKYPERVKWEWRWETPPADNMINAENCAKNLEIIEVQFVLGRSSHPSKI